MLRAAGRFFIRWVFPNCGGAIALAAILFHNRGVVFGEIMVGLRGAQHGWIGMLAATILREQVL
jgi:hypothetical protein